ncbi:MAG: SRPBCC family protein [Candidatus Dormiibacterota bacterium]
MPEAGDRITVPVSQDQAWDFAADARNSPRWVFGVREVWGDLRHPLLPGDHLKARLVAGGRMLESDWEVVSCERPSFLSSKGRAMGATAVLRIEFVALGPKSTEVRYHLSYQLPGGVIGALAPKFGLQSLLEAQAKASVRSLRRLLFRANRPTPGATRFEVGDSQSQ